MSSLISLRQVINGILLWEGLSTVQKIILIYMTVNSNNQGYCHVTVSDIAQAIPMHKSNVCKNQLQLKKIDLIRKRSRGMYWINFNHITGAEINNVGADANSIGANATNSNENQNDVVGDDANSIGADTINDSGSSVGADANLVGADANSIGADANSVGADANSEEMPYISLNSINTKDVLIEKTKEKEKPFSLSPLSDSTAPESIQEVCDSDSRMSDQQAYPEHPPTRQPQKLKRKTAPRKKRTFPSDFTVTDDMWNWYARQESFVLPIERATETWADAMRAKGTQYVDWTAAWRNGMKNQNKWEKQDREKQGRNRSHTDIANQVAQELCDEHGVEFRWD